jgi:hypothetical protein
MSRTAEQVLIDASKRDGFIDLADFQYLYNTPFADTVLTGDIKFSKVLHVARIMMNEIKLPPEDMKILLDKIETEGVST